MKSFFEKLNKSANLISVLSVVFTIVGTAISLNFKVTLFTLVGIGIAIGVGVIFILIADSTGYSAVRDQAHKKPSPFWSLLQVIIILALYLAITGGLVYGFIALVENFSTVIGAITGFFKSNWRIFALVAAIIAAIPLLIFAITKALILGRYTGRMVYQYNKPNIKVSVRKPQQRPAAKIEEDKKSVSIAELEKMFDAYKRKLDLAIKNATAPNDIISHMLKDTQETTEYFKISKSDAKKSFSMSIVFSGLGFALIIFAVVWGIVSENITPTIISSIGGVVTDVIGATAFFIRKQSLSQLNHYFSKLMRNQDILLSVRMVEKLNKTERDEMYKEIIKSVLTNTSQTS